MRKGWKIFWFIVLGIFVLILLLVGLVFYLIYSDLKFYNKAESKGSIRFGSPLFNNLLKECTPSYGGQSVMGESWEIRGLKDDKCLVVYNEPEVDKDCYDY